MGWTRTMGRVARGRRRPRLEILETRQLLTTGVAQPAVSPFNPDGSTNFDRIIGASAARAEFHVDGAGQSVAVIDTGVNYNHEALGGGIGIGHKVIAGVDFTGSPNGVLPTWEHGTGVAGIVASTDPAHPGIAPGVDIVALRVFGDDNSGSFTRIADALNWVVQHHNDYDITAVNLSVADGGVYTSNVFASDGGIGQRITSEIAQLDQLNIPVVVAAGNSFDGKAQGLGFPSIVSDAVSVTATDANDHLASNAQRLGPAKGGASAVKVAAPGVGITGPSDGNNYITEDGTSFAAPQVTGSIVLLQEMYEQAYHNLPTIAVLDQLLQQGAVGVHDGATGIDVGRLDVLNSAQILAGQIAASGGSSGGGGSTGGDGGSGGTKDPGSAAQTQVILNGISIGDYSTAQLAAKYPTLFAFLKGPVTSLRIWAPKGSKVDLGSNPPVVAGTDVHAMVLHSPAQAVAVAVKPHPITFGKSASLPAPTPVIHHAAAPKPKPKPKKAHHKSFFESLFPF